MAIQMDKTTIIVCSVVGSLGVLSAILGFSALCRRDKAHSLYHTGVRRRLHLPAEPGARAGGLRRHLPAGGPDHLLGGWRLPRLLQFPLHPFGDQAHRRHCVRRLLMLAAVIAWALLIEGAAWNANVVRETAPDCYYLKDGIFAGAGVLTLAATALGITSFIMLHPQPVAPAAAVDTPNRPGEKSPPPGFVMGQPVLPKPSQPQQGYGDAPQNPQPFAPGAAAQDNGSHSQSHAPNQDPAQGRPADASPPAVASATPEPGRPGEFAPPLVVAMGQPMAALPLPQVGVDIPGPVPCTAPQQQGTGYGKVIGQVIVKTGATLIGRVVASSILFDDTTTTTALSGAGDILASVMTGLTTTIAAVVQATN